MDHRVNHLAVVVSAVLYFVLGAFWYSPWLFADIWVRGLGKTLEEIHRANTGPAPYVVAFLSYLILAYTISWVLLHTGEQTVFRGMKIALLLFIGIAGSDALMHGMFEAKPLSFLAVNMGYTLSGMLITGLVVGGWKKKTSESISKSATAR